MKFTADEIFKHMSPATIAAWVADMDNAPEGPDELDTADLVLASRAVNELFAIVGMDAVALLEESGVNTANPLVMAAIEEQTRMEN